MQIPKWYHCSAALHDVTTATLTSAFAISSFTGVTPQRVRKLNSLSKELKFSLHYLHEHFQITFYEILLL